MPLLQLPRELQEHIAYYLPESAHDGLCVLDAKDLAPEYPHITSAASFRRRHKYLEDFTTLEGDVVLQLLKDCTQGKDMSLVLVIFETITEEQLRSIKKKPHDIELLQATLTANTSNAYAYDLIVLFICSGIFTPLTFVDPRYYYREKEHCMAMIATRGYQFYKLWDHAYERIQENSKIFPRHSLKERKEYFSSRLLGGKPILNACIHGHKDLVKLFITGYTPITYLYSDFTRKLEELQEAICAALKNNHPDCAKVILENPYMRFELKHIEPNRLVNIAVAACAKGHGNTLAFIMENQTIPCKHHKKMLWDICKHGHEGLLQFFLANVNYKKTGADIKTLRGLAHSRGHRLCEKILSRLC